MTGFSSASRALAKSDSGVTALEYALIAALVAVIAVGAMYGVGDKIGKNFDIVVAAITDAPAPGNDPSPPSGDGGGGSGGGEPDPADPAEISSKEVAPNTDDGQSSSPPTGDGDDNRISEGNDPGRGAGAANPNDTVMVSSAVAANAAKGGAGHSLGVGNAGGSTSHPGAGQVAESNSSGPTEVPASFGWDSSFRGDIPSNAPTGGSTSPTSSSAVGNPGAVTGPGSESGAGDGAHGTSEDSATRSALILLLWLMLIVGIVILGWKIALRAAARKDAEEALEDWKPAAFRAKSAAHTG